MRRSGKALSLTAGRNLPDAEVIAMSVGEVKCIVAVFVMCDAPLARIACARQRPVITWPIWYLRLLQPQ